MTDDRYEKFAAHRSQLSLLRKCDWLLKSFGARTHRYRLKPMLHDWYVCEIEEKYNVSLPEDYRDFLVFAGNGGAGPHYGLMTLQESLLHDPKALTMEFLSARFPHTTAFNPYYEGGTDDEFFDCAHVVGSLPISCIGCGHMVRLVLNGPLRGMVWEDYRDLDQGLRPIGLTFFEWYSKWLSDSFAALRSRPLTRILSLRYPILRQ